MKVLLLLCFVLCTSSLLWSVDADRKHGKEHRFKQLAKSSVDRARAKAEFEAGLSRLRAASRSGQLSMSMAYAAAMRLLHTYEAYEHQQGSSDIQFDISIDPAHPHLVSTNDRVLRSDDGVQWSYAEMTAIAGDYFGVKDSPNHIVCPDTEAVPASRIRSVPGMAQRFTDAFDDIWHNHKYGAAAPVGPLRGHMNDVVGELRAMITNEENGVTNRKRAAGGDINKVMHHGSDYYLSAMPGGVATITQMVSDYKGYSDTTKWAGKGSAEGNIGALAYNDDHFTWCAEATYRYGHQQAIALAHAAGVDARTAATQPAKDAASAKLIRAFGMDGWSSHFFSDRFSAGHIRTPRMEIRDVCESSWVMNKLQPDGDSSAGLTANVMHDEDNQNCLLVRNAVGYLWWACGDHRFFDAENANNRWMIHQAVAASIAEVRAAFVAGLNNVPAAAPASHNWLPTTATLSQREALENTCPKYKVIPAAGPTPRRMQARTDTDQMHGIPRPPVAITQGYGKSLRQATTLTSMVLPGGFVPLSPLSAIPQGTSPAALDCQYTAFGTDSCCNTGPRATPQQSTDTTHGSPNGSDSDKRETFINQCYWTQTNINQHVIQPIGRVLDVVVGG